MSKELDAVVEAVREVHSPLKAMDFGQRSPRQSKVCAGCGTDDGNWQVWPCPTIRAIERVLGGVDKVTEVQSCEIGKHKFGAAGDAIFCFRCGQQSTSKPEVS